MDYQTTEQGSSMKMWYLVIAVVLIVLALWYSYGQSTSTTGTTGAQTSAEQAQIPALSAGNSTADIANDLAQTPDPSAALNADANATAKAVQGL